jgi:hypothetical protein
MGGEALDRLKRGEVAGKTAKQAETGLSDLSKILSIRPAAGANSSK